MKKADDVISSNQLIANDDNKEKESDNIISRVDDIYKYKISNDNWLAKKDDQDRWYEITGTDFKPEFQASIDTLDRENPNARTKNAPKRSASL
jgi:hypothetical protein